jgi:hypothetical protein
MSSFRSAPCNEAGCCTNRLLFGKNGKARQVFSLSGARARSVLPRKQASQLAALILRSFHLQFDGPRSWHQSSVIQRTASSAPPIPITFYEVRRAQR